jgi:hypothetical protein
MKAEIKKIRTFLDIFKGTAKVQLSDCKYRTHFLLISFILLKVTGVLTRAKSSLQIFLHIFAQFTSLKSEHDLGI